MFWIETAKACSLLGHRGIGTNTDRKIRHQPTVYRPSWEGSKWALADEALQLWDQAEALVEERVDE
jgi:hypothetical protein